MTPPEIKQGQNVTAGLLQGILDEAKRGQVRPGAGVATHDSGEGTTVSIPGKPRMFYREEDCKRFRLMSRDTCPRFGLLHEFAAVNNDAGPRTVKARKPTRTGFGQVLVAMRGVVENGVTWGAFQGVVPVRYSFYNGLISEGDYLGPLHNSYDAIKYPKGCGPLYVLKDLGNVPFGSAGTIGLAIVDIRRTRADHINVRTQDGDFDGTYQTIIWTGFTLSQTEFAKTAVS